MHIDPFGLAQPGVLCTAFTLFFFFCHLRSLISDEQVNIHQIIRLISKKNLANMFSLQWSSCLESSSFFFDKFWNPVLDQAGWKNDERQSLSLISWVFRESSQSTSIISRHQVVY